MRLRRQSNAEVITVDTAAPLGKGGEARVYAVQDAPALAAKVYEADKDLSERIAKLTVMRDLPPDMPEGKDGHVSIAWPLDLLCDADNDTRITGFLMGRVHDAVQVIDVYNPQTRLREYPLFDYRYLLRTARNLAAAVRALHARGYIIGDLKHSNVLVTQTALVTLVDADSFQVRDPQTNHVYACPVHTPDFTPPEMQEEEKRRKGEEEKEYGIRNTEGENSSFILHPSSLPAPLNPQHDLFALAVLIFHLLMEGTHPFAGVYLEDGDPPAFEERIARGHFPYGNRDVPYRPNTRYAPSFALLPPTLRELFVRCFEDGHDNPDLRPDARTWQRALDEAGRNLRRCDANAQHFYGNHLDACPWCERRQTQLRGLDPFPSEQAVMERAKPQASASKNSKPGYYFNDSYQPPPDPPAAPSTFNSDFITWLVFVGFATFICILLASIGSVSGNNPHVVAESRSEQFTPYGGTETVPTTVASLPAGSSGGSALPVPPGIIRQVAYSPDGKTILGGGSSIVLWDAHTGKVRRTFVSSGSFAYHFAAAPDGKMLATTDNRGGIVLWNMQTGKARLRLAPNALCFSVTFSHDGNLVAEISPGDAHSSSNIGIWNAHTGKKVRQWQTYGTALPWLVFSPVDDTLVSFVRSAMQSPDLGQQKSRINVWDARTGLRRHSMENLYPVSDVTFSPDGKTIIAGGTTPRCWNVETGAPVPASSSYTQSDYAFAFSPKQDRFANIRPTHEVEVVSAATGATQFVLPLLSTSGKTVQPTSEPGYVGYTSVAFAPDGNTLVTGSCTQGAQVWDAHTGKLLRTLNSEENEVHTTASGLKYVDLVKGTGAMPKRGQTVTVHYVGMFEDGTTFDTSQQHGQPYIFTLGKDEVIRGWEEGIATMRVGGKRKLTIPPSLGYGSAGMGTTIPPNAMLIFEITLLKVEIIEP